MRPCHIVLGPKLRRLATHLTLEPQGLDANVDLLSPQFAVRLPDLSGPPAIFMLACLGFFKFERQRKASLFAVIVRLRHCTRHGLQLLVLVLYCGLLYGHRPWPLENPMALFWCGVGVCWNHTVCARGVYTEREELTSGSWDGYILVILCKGAP
jgi:hypothetical protein